jgi:uncharacterized protein (DUF2336 family)
MQDQLSAADVQQLMANPIAVIRAQTAAKVAAHATRDALSAKERETAFEILCALSEDVSAKVREALAEGLCRSPDLPRDLALKLAADVETVALPVLELSTVFTDADLIELIRAGNETKQVAIACRAEISETVCDALIETGRPAPARALIKNDGAKIGEGALGTLLDRWGGDEEIKLAMVHRAVLPLTIAERLVTLVSEQLREYLLVKHELPLKTACDLVAQSRERALARLVEGSGTEDRAEVARLVEQLYGHGRLTPGLVARLICMGDMAFFEEAIARMAVVPAENAAVLIRDEGTLGLKALCERAGLTEPMMGVIRIAVDLICRYHDGRTPGDRDAFLGEVMARLKSCEYAVDSRDLEDLLAHLERSAEPVH